MSNQIVLHYLKLISSVFDKTPLLLQYYCTTNLYIISTYLYYLSNYLVPLLSPMYNCYYKNIVLFIPIGYILRFFSTNFNYFNYSLSTIFLCYRNQVTTKFIIHFITWSLLPLFWKLVYCYIKSSPQLYYSLICICYQFSANFSYLDFPLRAPLKFYC